MQTEFHATIQAPTSNFQWGTGYAPKNSGKDLFDLEPQINGRSVEWILDIRDAPGGEKWSFLASKCKDSHLFVRVLAAAGDQFTLYLEKGPLEEVIPKLRGGIHLDASGRTEAKLTNYVIKFDLPFEKYISISNLENPLLAANTCQLAQLPKDLPVKVIEVKERQKKRDHCYFIIEGKFKDEKINLLVEHSFSAIGFRFEYKSQPAIEAKRTRLKAELFAIEDHSSLSCLCSRKGKTISLIEIEWAKLNLPKVDCILVWGPHDTQFLGERELGISTDPRLQE